MNYLHTTELSKCEERFHHISQLEDECQSLKKLIAERDVTINSIEVNARRAESVAVRLNKEVIKNKKENAEEKAIILKEHRREIKSLKKDLGRSNSKIINLEREITRSHEYNNSKLISNPTEPPPAIVTETDDADVDVDSDAIYCSICATSLNHFTPRYFMGEPVNPTCKNCDDIDDAEVFSSFPLEGMPHTLVTHWSPANTMHQLKNYDISLRSHCVKLFTNEYENKCLMAEEVEKWNVLFQKNLEETLIKWNDIFTKMDNRLDQALSPT